MKTSSLYFRCILIKVLKLLKKTAILFLLLQGCYTIASAIYAYFNFQTIPSTIDIVVMVSCWLGVVVLRACKDILDAYLIELSGEIEHNKKVKQHKTEIDHKNAFRLAEAQAEAEAKEVEANILPVRKFHIQKITNADAAVLDTMIGLENIKKQLKKMRATFEYEKRCGGGQSLFMNHLAFYGSPGTGKTTVAKAVAAILYEAGIIPKAKYVAVNGNDLLGAYMGQTAPTINALFKQGAGGVIFIDEAYIIANAASDSNGNGYGQECVAQLLTLLEKRDSRTVVIFGGYKDRMDEFFRMNPGLRSRISTVLEFPDFGPEELLQITEIQLKSCNHKLSENVKPILLRFFCDQMAYCRQNRIAFSNGRFATKVAKELFSQHALNAEEDKTIGKIITEKDLDFEALRMVY